MADRGPPDIPQDKVDAYRQAAERVAKGGSGYLPNGSSAQCADAPRSLAPFEPRLRYLNEMLVLAGTGGMLTMLAASGTGTLAGSAHADAFKTLAKMDAADISECLQRQFDRRVLESAGLLLPGERAKAWFTLDYKSEPDNEKVVSQVKTLHDAGLDVDAAQVEELTGFRCVRREERPAGTRPGAEGDLPTLGKADADLPPLGKGIANELPMPGKRAEALPKLGKDEEAFAAALQRDLRPVAKALQAALARGEGPGELKRRLERILETCGTESAAALESAMKAAGTAALANMADRNGREHAPAGSPEGGRFLPKGGTAAPKQASGSENPDPPEVQEEQIARARATIARCLETHEDAIGEFSRGDLGTISLLYGSPVDTPEGKAWGLSHFAHRADTVAHLPETLIRGRLQEPYQSGQKRNIVWGKYTAVIALTNDPDGPPRPERWVLTAFQPSDRQKKGDRR